MKNFLKKTYRLILKSFATRYLERSTPDIIAITGSVGKTSTKDAVYQILSAKFKVRKTEGSQNEEIGVPATILGLGIEKFPLGWIKNILLGSIKSFLIKDSSDKLILEMGADRPGDIKYLTSFIKPKIAIITRVACAHLEFFGSLENIAKEKGTLVESLPRGGWAILNYDDPYVRAMESRTIANILTFGFDKNADIWASKIKHTSKGISFEVNCDGEKQLFHMDVIGKHQVYSALSAIACGLIYGMNLNEISSALKKYKLPADRTNIINGIKNTFVINDTYNANPESTKAALETLDELGNSLNKKARKVFVFGDMLELGPKSKNLHIELVREAKGMLDILVLVGEINKYVFENLKSSYKKSIFWFPSSDKAAEEISQIIEEGDIILVKGSRGMKMEKVVKSLKL